MEEKWNDAKSKAELRLIRDWCARQQWREAKTYRYTTPHEYIVVELEDPRRSMFKRVFKAIEKYGKREFFFGKPWLYLYLGDGFKYFSADGEGWQEDRVCLNRCTVDRFYGGQK